MSDTELHYQNITDLARQVRQGQLSPVEITEHLLDRVEKLDPRLHAIKGLTRDRALAEARAAELELRAGHDRGPLHGIPYVAKDLYDVKGEPTAAGCRLLEHRVAQRDCAVVRRLARAGMVLLGKSHTVQLAFGAVGINHDTGTPHNPYHHEPHVPGGSSSGSAVAVAAGLAPMGLGSDTGGSVRIPSSLCGTVGLKTTVGRISRAGIYPLSWTLDTAGPLTRSVEDAALVFLALQGEDAEDESTCGVAPLDVQPVLTRGVEGLRIAVGDPVLFEGIDPEVEQCVTETGAVFESLGAQVKHIELPELSQIVSDERRGLMISAEACAVNRKLLDDHFEQLDPVVAQRMIKGRKLPAPEYYDELRQWMRWRKDVMETLRDVDAVIAPTTMIPAAPLQEVDANFDQYMAYSSKYNRNTYFGNILNLCGVSLPCGFTIAGLPVGLMIYAKTFQEDMALRVAYAYEQATSWHQRRPDLSWA